MINMRNIKLLFFILILPITLYISLKDHKEKEPKLPIIKNTPYEFFPIQQWTTNNGAKVLYVHTPGLPFVDIAISFEAGSARDGKKPGLAILCAHILNQGTLNLNADDIAAKFEDSGAQYNIQVDKDKVTLSLRTLTNPLFLNPVTELFSNVLSNPSFPEKAIEIQKNQALIAIKHSAERPQMVATKAFFKALYKDHPYASPIFGTEESVVSIQKRDLIDFYQKYYVSHNASITIVGDLTEAQARVLTTQMTEKLTQGNKAEPLPIVDELNTAFEIDLPFPSEQTHILMGEPCATAGDKDWFTLLVGNEILGSHNMNSQLFKAIRGERALAYSVTSSLSRLQRPAPFAISMQTEKSQTNQAIKIVQKTLTHFVKEGPKEEELNIAKNGLISALPHYINNNAKISHLVTIMGFYNLPLDFLSTYTENVNAITKEKVKETFQRRIHPNKMGLIVVGTKEP